MDPVNAFNQNIGPGPNLLFEPKFVNIEYIFYKIYTFFQSVFGLGGGSSSGSNIGSSSSSGVSSASDMAGGASQYGGFFKGFIYFAIVFFLTVIAYSIVMMFEVRAKEKKYLKEQIDEYAKKQAEKAESKKRGTQSKNPRWEVVLEYLKSTSENDWRLAILEADSMLEDLLNRLGFEGESLGEKLKSVNKDNFRNLNLAWEAHAVRNKIAHEGSEFAIGSKEANRVVALYETIFRDYDYI